MYTDDNLTDDKSRFVFIFFFEEEEIYFLIDHFHPIVERSWDSRDRSKVREI